MAGPSAGDIAGGNAGPAESGGDNSFKFGNLVSGGSGGFNPFAASGVERVLNPKNVAVFGVVVLGGIWMLKKK